MEQFPVTEKQEYWLSHIERAQSEGLSAAAYCERKGLSVIQMYYYANWHRKRSQKTDTFMEIKRQERGPQTPVVIRIGKQITMEIPADPSFVMELLRGMG